MNNRLKSYAIDVIYFFVITYIVFIIINSINNQIGLSEATNGLLVLRYAISWIIFLLLSYFFFGVIPYIFRGSVGKKIIGLRVYPEVGKITIFRLYIREFILKHIFITSIFLVPMVVIFRNELFASVKWIFIPFTVLILLNLYTLLSSHKFLHDFLLFTYVDREDYTVHNTVKFNPNEKA